MVPLRWLGRMAAVLGVIGVATAGPPVSVANLRTEYLVNPLGLDRARPRLQWELVAPDGLRGVKQTSYRVTVGLAAADGTVWDSGVVQSNRTFQVEYAGPVLAADTVYYWAVSVTTSCIGCHSVAATSPTALFSIGLLQPSDWAGGEGPAHFIGAVGPPGELHAPPAPPRTAAAPWFRKTFTLPSEARSGSALATDSPAFVYLASVGYHELYINGEMADPDSALIPSISYLPKRVLYRTYNVSNLLRPGRKNVLAVWAAAGWGAYGDLHHGVANSTVPLLLVKMTIGDTHVLVSDDSWKTSPSNLVSNGGGPGGGEAIDGSRANPNWNTVDMDDSHWASVATFPLTGYTGLAISADAMEPTRRESVVKVATIVQDQRLQPEAPNPVWLVTMNELFTGWFEVTNMTGPEGSTVHFQISSTSGTPEEFGMADSYTFGPSCTGAFRMRFAYHEIHYITITGLSKAPSNDNVIGYRMTSLPARTGDFQCSSDLITQMYHATVNNYRGLTTGGMSVDCPHRERRGYGGDGHTSYQFALANYPVGAFFNKWMRDFADVQGVPGGFGTPPGTGLVPNTAPTVGGGGGPAWGGFVVTNPWQTYNTLGDTTILRDMYPTMKRLLKFYTENTKEDGLLHPWDASQWDFLGDWLTPHGSEHIVNSPENLLFNNCYLHYITHLVAKIAAILNEPEDVAIFADAASKIATAVNSAFGNTSTGVYLDRLQTHAVMPLASGVVPANVEPLTWSNLETQLKITDRGHLDTGLTGTYFMTKLMMEAGRNDLVFTWANKTDFPSYGHFLNLGYTTWPEQWDVKPGDSLMHGCYNAIGLWFVEGLAGIRVHFSESPPITIRPGIDAGDIKSASGRRFALYGMASSSWAMNGSSLVHNVTIPAGGQAKVMVPSMSGASAVTESGTPVSSARGVTVLGTETLNKIKYVSLVVGAGTYNFLSTSLPLKA